MVGEAWWMLDLRMDFQPVWGSLEEFSISEMINSCDAYIRLFKFMGLLPTSLVICIDWVFPFPQTIKHVETSVL